MNRVFFLIKLKKNKKIGCSYSSSSSSSSSSGPPCTAEHKSCTKSILHCFYVLPFLFSSSLFSSQSFIHSSAYLDTRTFIRSTPLLTSTSLPLLPLPTLFHSLYLGIHQDPSISLTLSLFSSSCSIPTWTHTLTGSPQHIHTKGFFFFSFLLLLDLIDRNVHNTHIHPWTNLNA